MANVFVEGPLHIGEDNVFFPYSTVGVAPQDLKYRGERSGKPESDGETRSGNSSRFIAALKAAAC